jgi:hypothetical protein
VFVARSEWHGLQLSERTVVGLPDASEPACVTLAAQRAETVPTYLVVPLAGDPPAWIDELLAEVERTHPPLAWRDRLVAVYDLHDQPDPGLSLS